MKTLIQTKSCLAFIIFLLIVSGCGNSDPSPTLTCFLKKWKTVDDAYVGENTFTYSADMKQITILSSSTFDGSSDSETFTLTADDDGNIIKIEFEDSPDVYYEYIYNASLKLTRQNQYTGTDLDYRVDYEYNSSGQFIKQQYYDLSSGTPVKSDYESFEYANSSSKNPLKQKSYSADGTLNLTSEFEYDNKKTPYDKLSFIIEIFSENNVTKVTRSDSGGVLEVTSTTYEYNDKGYPTKAITSDGSGDSTVETFTYECK